MLDSIRVRVHLAGRDVVVCEDFDSLLLGLDSLQLDDLVYDFVNVEFA